MALADSTVRRLAEALASQDAANDLQTQINAIAPTYVTPASVSIAGGIKSSSKSGGFGYATGAGGTVTQATSKGTGVTLNNYSGQITMNSANLAAGATVTFAITQTGLVGTHNNDVLIVNIASGATAGAYTVLARNNATGGNVSITNNTAGGLAEAIVLNVVRIRGAAL
jgi:hypothetical protein